MTKGNEGSTRKCHLVRVHVRDVGGDQVSEKTQMEENPNPLLSCNTDEERHVLQQYKEEDELFFATEEYAAFWATAYDSSLNNSMMDLKMEQSHEERHDTHGMKKL